MVVRWFSRPSENPISYRQFAGGDFGDCGFPSRPTVWRAPSSGCSTFERDSAGIRITLLPEPLVPGRGRARAHYEGRQCQGVRAIWI